MRRKWPAFIKWPLGVLLVLLAFVGLDYVSGGVACASIFGEENGTLVQMLVQLFGIQRELKETSETAGQIASATNELMSDYQRVNAGYNEIKNYSFQAFASDFTGDLYRQYPGFAQLANASKNLSHWDTDSFATSPFTSYQAVTALFGDVSAPLRADIAAGRTNVDQALLHGGEAAGGLAAAATAEQASATYDAQVKRLAALAQNASPGVAAQLSARANILMAAQNSYLMRLLARTVRLESIDQAAQYGADIAAHNAPYSAHDAAVSFATDALRAPALINFGDATAGVDAPLDPYSNVLDPYAGPSTTTSTSPSTGGASTGTPATTSTGGL